MSFRKSVSIAVCAASIASLLATGFVQASQRPWYGPGSGPVPAWALQIMNKRQTQNYSQANDPAFPRQQRVPTLYRCVPNVGACCNSQGYLVC